MQVTIYFPYTPDIPCVSTFRVKEVCILQGKIRSCIQAWSDSYNHPIDLSTTHEIVQERIGHTKLNIYIAKRSFITIAAQ